MLNTLHHITARKDCGNAFKIIFAAVCLAFILMTFGIPNASAGTRTLTVAATVISKNNCRFRSGPAAINFGALDPGNTNDVTRTASMRFRCQGSAPMATFAFSTDDGLYESAPGATRMKHATENEFLPYSLSLSPLSGTVPKGEENTLTITGTVTSANYRSASAGNYRDTVVISIAP